MINIKYKLYISKPRTKVMITEYLDIYRDKTKMV